MRYINNKVFIIVFFFHLCRFVNMLLFVDLSLSLGQRFAILEEKIVLAHVLRNFTIDSTQSYDELLVCAELITRPREGIFVSLTKR